MFQIPILDTEAEEHSTISQGFFDGQACGVLDIKVCGVLDIKVCGVPDNLSQLFTTSKQFCLSKQGNGPLRRGFRAAINPFKMQLDLEECDRPGSTVHI